MAVAYIDAYRGQFGVQPICRVLSGHGLRVAASTYYAARSRPASRRSVTDAALAAEIKRVFKDSGEVYGARKVWRQLHREHIGCARCTVERLMRQAGLHGARRGRPKRTTIPADRASWPPDLVRRDFHPPAPNRLWVVDITARRGAHGEGDSADAAVEDLRVALEGLIAEFGPPDELTVTADVA